MNPAELVYKNAGVDLEAAREAKRRMSAFVDVDDERLLSKLGAYASIVDTTSCGIEDPVIVLKVEEPGSKQLLAFEHGSIESLSHDIVNHLVNDILVVGAMPVAVLDTIVCGRLDPDTVVSLVQHMSIACRENGCLLVGGETSEQPGVLAPGRYVVCAAGLGIAARNRVVDGRVIEDGSAVLAIPSNGLHTNGYTLVRQLLEQDPSLAAREIDNETFLELLLRPHTSYYNAVTRLMEAEGLLGLAHITGGGIPDNLTRIIPPGLGAAIDLAQIEIPPVFSVIREASGMTDQEMVSVFNLGVGMIAILHPGALSAAVATLSDLGLGAYPIGSITRSDEQFVTVGTLQW